MIVRAFVDAIETDQPIVLIAGDGHHGWLNTTALVHLAMPVRESVVSEAEWFRAYARLASVLGDDGTGPDAYRRTFATEAPAVSRAARATRVGVGCTSGWSPL